MTNVADSIDVAALRRVIDESDIRQLSVNYALATDALGRGDEQYGRALYHRTFTPDAQVKLEDRLSATGPDGWAEVVIRALASNSATQHLIGTINVTLDDSPDGVARTGRMTTYLSASHERSPGGDIHVVLGTYWDEVVRTEAGWRIATRTLVYTSTELRKHTA